MLWKLLQPNASPKRRKLLQNLRSIRFAKDASRLWASPQRYAPIATATVSMEVQRGLLIRLFCWVPEKSAQLLLRTSPEEGREPLGPSAEADREGAAEVIQSLLVSIINFLAGDSLYVGAIVKGIGERLLPCIQLFSSWISEYVEAAE